MAWYIVRFHTDAYPDEPQYMLSEATNGAHAIDQVMGYFETRGIEIKPDDVYPDQVRRVGRPGRQRQIREAAGK